MNKLLTTLAAVVFAASAGIASAQAPGKGEMKAAPGSPAAQTPAPAPSAAPDTKGSPSAMDSGTKAKKSKAKKTKKARKGKAKKAKSEDASTAAPK